MTTDIKSIKKKSVYGVVAYSLRTGLMYIISVLATGLLSIYLGPADFGVYFVVSALMGIFTFMSDIGLAATLIQKKDEPTIEELRTTFTVQQLLAWIILGFSVGLTPFWIKQLNLSQDGVYLLYALAISFLLASWKTIPSILLERKMEFSKIVVPQLIETLLFYGVAVYFAHKGLGVKSYTIAIICRSVAGVVAIYMLQRWPIGIALTKQTVSRLLHFGAKFQLNDLLARIKDDLFVAVLAKFLPAEQMGLIGWAKRWSMFPYQFSVNSVMAVAFPTFARLQDNRDLLKKALEKSLFFISLLIFPILIGIVLVAYPLTILIPAYAKWQPALPSLAFFCLNIGFAAIANPMINTLNAIGKINRTLILMVVMTIATWVTTPIMFIYFGTVGVSAASAAVAAISLLVVVEVKKIVPLNFIGSIWRQFTAACVMGMMLYLTTDMWANSWSGLFMAIVGGFVTYLLVMLAIGYEKILGEIKSLV